MKIIKRLDEKKCKALVCPAIMQDENGDYIIIGTDVTGEVENLEQFNAGCAQYEKIVKVPAEVFESIKKSLK